MDSVFFNMNVKILPTRFCLGLEDAGVSEKKDVVFVGLACTAICTVYDRMYGDFPAKNTVCTPYMPRVGQNRIYTPYMTVYLVISLPKIPYIHRIYMVLANPIYAYGSGQPQVFGFDVWTRPLPASLAFELAALPQCRIPGCICHPPLQFHLRLPKSGSLIRSACSVPVICLKMRVSSAQLVLCQ